MLGKKLCQHTPRKRTRRRHGTTGQQAVQTEGASMRAPLLRAPLTQNVAINAEVNCELCCMAGAFTDNTGAFNLSGCSMGVCDACMHSIDVSS